MFKRSYLLLAAPILALAACASPPRATAPGVPPPAAVQQTGPLIGLSAAQLVSRLGTPALQVPEGNSVMLQYRVPACIMDAYLYPQRGQERAVTHVDARDVNGQPVDRDRCLALIEASR